MNNKKTKITVNKIPNSVQNAIRASFSYKGLVKALNSKIITKADIKAEAINEQKNKKLLMNQRVHTVLMNDLESNINLTKQNKAKMTSAKGVDKIVNKVNKVVNKVNKMTNKDELLDPLKKKLGQDFGIGWKGIDEDGDLLEVAEISPNNWLKFKIDKISGQADIASFPIDKFLKDLDVNPIYSIDSEDANDLATSNLKKLNNKARLSLMNRIHSKTMAKLQRIKSKQRNILEQILKRNEDKKIKELLANINGG